jgi:hypothetical protein
MKRFALLTGLALLLAATASWAEDDDDDDDERGQGQSDAAARATPQWKQYETECGSCHLAFPPRMLPAKSWTTLMGGLDNHFGQNAEVDAATGKALSAWLVKQAGTDVGGAPLRITTLPWWKREHREVAANVYQRKAITSPANCAACHPGANQGAFGEHAVRIPRDAPAAR